jgi:minor extracellular serine protease Vpr
VQPAHPGDFLQIYATGLGVATPGGKPDGAVLPTGSLAPASGSPLYQTVITPIVTIGGVDAPVLFSGLAPGYNGLYQVDVQIPAGITSGDDVSITLAAGTVVDTATVAIK